MKRREREHVMKQGVVAPDTSTARRDREALEEDLRASGLQGRPLRLRLRNFSPSADGYLGALGGPLPYMVRLREITELTADHEQRLEAARNELLAAGLGDEAFAAAWHEQVQAWRFDEVNDLIDRHNRYYPAESRLPMDPSTGDNARVGGADYRRRPLDAAWALEQFPSERDASSGE